MPSAGLLAYRRHIQPRHCTTTFKNSSLEITAVVPAYHRLRGAPTFQTVAYQDRHRRTNTRRLLVQLDYNTILYMDGIRSKGPLSYSTERLFDEVQETAPPEVLRGLETGSSCEFLQFAAPNHAFGLEAAEPQTAKSLSSIPWNLTCLFWVRPVCIRR